MDKKTLLGLLLVGVILFGYVFYNSKQAAKFQREQFIADSIERAEHPEKFMEIVHPDTTNASEYAQNTIQPDEKAKQDSLMTITIGQSLMDASKATAETFVIENNLLKVWVSSQGGTIYNVELKDYKRYDGSPLRMFKDGSSYLNMELFIKRTYNSTGINTSDYVFTDAELKNISLPDGSVAQALHLRLPIDYDTNSALEYVYTLYPDNYMIDFDVNFINMAEATRNLTFFNFDWRNTALQNEKGFKNENMNTTVFYRYPDDKKPSNIGNSEGSREKNIKTKINWVSFKQQFFSSIFVAKDNFTAESLGFETKQPGSGEIKDFHASLTVPYDSSRNTYQFQFYFGPNQYTIMKSYGMRFEKVIPLGGKLVSWINTGLTINIFNWLSKFISNYGIIILILTVIIKLIILPLTYKSYMSTAKMRVLQPQLNEINEQYPNQEDALKKQQAIMELYRRSGVNPMGGCIPMLIQMPILFAMFRFLPASIELRGKHFLWADDLSSYDSIVNLPFNIPLYGDHISLFALLMAVSLFLYSRMTYKQTASAGPQMAGMKFMSLYLMPIMMLCWFNSYASGLTYYYFLSQIFTMLIMYIIRCSVNEEKVLSKMQNNAAKADRAAASRKKSKWMMRYEEALKQQQQMQRQQQQQMFGGHQKTHTAKPQSTKFQPPKKRRK